MVTVTGNFEALTGTGNGYVTATLINFGSNVPRVSGTGVIVNTFYQSTPGTNFSLSVWGNDVISPTNTYYQISFFTAGSSVATATATYQFNTGSSYDLSTAVPLVVTGTTPLALANVAYSGSYTDLSNVPGITSVVCSGAVNGSNTTFTFTAPSTSVLTALYTAGIFQIPTVLSSPPVYGDYTVSNVGTAWTVTTASAPSFGNVVALVWNQ